MTKKPFSRRRFVQIAGAAGITAACRGSEPEEESLGAEAGRTGRNYGLQLYTLREILPNDPQRILRAVAEIGYSEVEISSVNLEKIVPIARSLPLEVPGCHFEPPLITGDWSTYQIPAGFETDYTWEVAVERAKQAGIQFLIIPYLRPGERGDIDFYRSFVEKMNGAGEVCRSADMRLCYHQHAFEFEPMEGTSPFEVMLQGFEQDLVGIELDVFWASVAGHDPAQLLKDHPNKFPLVHLKDKAEGTPQGYTETLPPESFKEVGSGVLDFPEILAAADESGVEHFVVEQDQCPGDPIESVRKSFEYLRSLG